MTQIQKHLSQSQHHYQNQLVPKQNPNSSTAPISSSMWNPKGEQHQEEEEDESWEVRAFAEDTSRNNSMGTTWPPRSYTCTFCRREFRSAQALGGHMNVHRRDRARLHQPPPQYYPSPPAASVAVSPNNLTSSFINIPPHHELVANGGLCLLYHFPSPNNIAPKPLNACGESVVPFSSNSYPPNNNLMVMPAPSFDFTAGMINGFSSCSCSSNKVEEEEEEEPINSNSTNINHGHHEEELDLELRLGHRSTTPS